MNKRTLFAMFWALILTGCWAESSPQGQPQKAVETPCKEAWCKNRIPQEELKIKLSKIQYDVTQHEGTERPFQNEYWDNKAQGIYVDIVSGEPLFSSTHKYKSGTGWPSFYQPIDSQYVTRKVDRKLFVERVEVRSKHGDSHLGHVFKDGPEPTGLRYCINSAALRFVPIDKMKEQGYEEYLSLFKVEPAK